MKQVLTVPNALGFARMLSAPVIFWLLIKENSAAFWLMGAALFTDLIDGMLARLLNQITEFGRTLDPIADKVLFTFVLLGVCIRYQYTSWLLFFSIIIVLYSIIFIIIQKDLQAHGVYPNMLGKVCVFFNSFVLWSMTWGFSSRWLLLLFTVLLVVPQANYFIIYLKIKKQLKAEENQSIAP